jgi:PAS domain-containing protein
MTSVTWSITEDIIPLLAFTLAFVALMLIPVRPGGAFNRAAKFFFGASIFCYLLSALASIMGHVVNTPWFAAVAGAGAPAASAAILTSLQPVVDAVEVLWVPFILFGVYSLYALQQLNDALAAQHAMTQASEMLESVVETTPAGIMVLNDVGHVTFANTEARRLLDIDDDDAAATIRNPGWRIHLGDDRPDGYRPDFAALLRPEPFADQLVVVEWPNGWRRRLSVNTALFGGVAGDAAGVAGVVATFVEREPWRNVPGAR